MGSIEFRLLAHLISSQHIIIADSTPTLTKTWIDELEKTRMMQPEPCRADKHRKSKGERKREGWRLK